MKHLPGYLNIGPETYYAPRSNRDNEDYQPLLAVWLIDLSLSLGWLDSPPRAGLEGVFGSNEFIDITGLHDLEALFDRRTQDEDLDALFNDDAPAEPTHAPAKPQLQPARPAQAVQCGPALRRSGRHLPRHRQPGVRANAGAAPARQHQHSECKSMGQSGTGRQPRSHDLDHQ